MMADCPPAVLPNYERAFHCLSINEILQNIADVLHLDGGKRALASLAMTCRTLHGAPMSTLWHEMNSLVPLLKTIPGHEWYMFATRYLSDGGTVRMWEANIDDNDGVTLDTTRLRLYCSYVEKFHLVELLDLDRETFLYFSNKFSRSFKLFPRVRCFEWRISEAVLSRALYAQMFINPRLEALHITVNTDTVNPLECYSHDLAAECAALKTLSLHDLPITELKKLPCPIPIFRCESLVRFESDVPISFAGFVLLSQMPLLRFAGPMRLSPSSYDLDDVASIPSIPASEICFPAARMLSLKIRSLDTSCLSFIRSITSATISSINISVSRAVLTESILHEYLQTLSLHRLSLCEIRLLLWGRSHGLHPDLQMTMDTIMPLLCLANLTTLTILSDGFVIDKKTTRDLSLGIPHLRVLELLALSDDYPGSHDSYPAPLDSLEPLARLCTNLQILSMAVDCSSTPVVPDNWRSQSGVSRGDIRLHNYLRSYLPSVHAYISALFPQFDIEANRYYRDATSFEWM